MQINNLLISSDLQANLYDLTDNIHASEKFASYLVIFYSDILR